MQWAAQCDARAATTPPNSTPRGSHAEGGESALGGGAHLTWDRARCMAGRGACAHNNDAPSPPPPLPSPPGLYAHERGRWDTGVREKCSRPHTPAHPMELTPRRTGMWATPRRPLTCPAATARQVPAANDTWPSAPEGEGERKEKHPRAAATRALMPRWRLTRAATQPDATAQCRRHPPCRGHPRRRCCCHRCIH